jgi:5-methylcytosine-specific restriction endonuclease McrA
LHPRNHVLAAASFLTLVTIAFVGQEVIERAEEIAAKASFVAAGASEKIASQDMRSPPRCCRRSREHSKKSRKDGKLRNGALRRKVSGCAGCAATALWLSARCQMTEATDI